MKTRRFFLPVLLALALTGVVPGTESQARPQHDMADSNCDFSNCPGGMRGAGMRCAGLSPEQQQKYTAIVSEYTKKMEPVEDQVFIKRQELRALQNAATPNLEAVREMATELRKLHRQLWTLHEEMTRQIEKEVGKPAGPAPRHGRQGHGKGQAQGKAESAGQ